MHLYRSEKSGGRSLKKGDLYMGWGAKVVTRQNAPPFIFETKHCTLSSVNGMNTVII